MVRKSIAAKVKAFQLRQGDEVCAAMHVRRGDIIYHLGQARPYIELQTYVRAARAFIDALGVTTILLLTDSQAVIEEAESCEKEHPDVCGGLKWRYVKKKRWYGAEGGW